MRVGRGWNRAEADGWGGGGGVERTILVSSEAQTQMWGLDGTAWQAVTIPVVWLHLPFLPNPVPSQSHLHSFCVTHVTPTT